MQHGDLTRYRFCMLIFNRIVPNRHVLRQIYRLIFKPKFWRNYDFSPDFLRSLDEVLEEKRRARAAQGTRDHADPS